MTLNQGKRRIMRRFRLDKIAIVDEPAQTGADIVLRKRASVDKARFAAMLSNTNGHTHLIETWDAPLAGTTSYACGPDEEHSHNHPWQVLEDGTIAVGESMGHTHEVDPAMMLAAVRSWISRTAAEEAARAATMTKGMPAADEAREVEKAAGDGGGQDTDMTTKNDATAGTQAAPLEALAKRVERAEAVARLNDAGKAHLAKMANDTERDRFLALSADQQAAEINKANAMADDPVEYTANDGTAYRKSAGAAVIALAKRLDDQAKRTEQAERRAAENALVAKRAALAKRADTELRNLPGTVEDRASLLDAIDTYCATDAELRKRLAEIMKGANSAAAGAFDRRGARDGVDSGEDSPADQLDRLAKARQKEKGGDYYAAYEAVSRENPALAKAAVASDIADDDQEGDEE